MNTSLLRLCPLLVVLAVSGALAKEKSGRPIYSDVHPQEDSGDLVGIEFELKTEGSVAMGVVRIYQGRCAEPVQVTGTFSGNAVHVSGEGEGFGKIDIAGKLQHGRFDGVLRLDRVHSSEKIRLRRIKKPHC